MGTQPNGGFPPDMLTSDKDFVRRLRVDVAQTGFFDGREFRTFKEFSPEAGNGPFTGVYVVKVESPVDYIVFQIQAEIESGSIRLETVSGGTEGGSFSEVLPVIARNLMTEVPDPQAAQLSLIAGGTLTGGTVVDVLRAKTDSNSNRSFSVGGITTDERGNPPQTIYFRATMIDCVGIIRGRWEERA